MKKMLGLLALALSINAAHAQEIVEVRAQDYVASQNVASGAPDGFGDCIVTRRPGNLPTSAEYEITVQESGPYRLSLSYAALDPRPITVNVNGQVISSNAASAPTGGWYEGNRLVTNEGTIRLNAGVNRILISRGSDFPHLHSIKVVGP